MITYWLQFILESDTAFGRGDGVAGLVDAEVQHDQYGLPYLGGRTVKGLLVMECADILAALPDKQKKRWQKAAYRLFGRPGSTVDEQAQLMIGNAELPADLRRAIAGDIRRKVLTREQVLESLTTLRRQTAMDESGVPKEHSLRTIRLVLRKTIFAAALRFMAPPHEDDLMLLTACVAAWRRAGTARNRGHGRLKARILYSNDVISKTYLTKFTCEVLR